MIRHLANLAILALCIGLTAAEAQQAAPAAAPTAARAPRIRPFPPPLKIEGQPNELRPPEKADDHPVFPGQTRAPYHASVSVQPVTITDKLERPWAVALLPDGRYLVTEKAGALRIVGKDGALSEPFSVSHLFAGRGELLDVALDPEFQTNQRIFFTFTRADGGGLKALAVARAILDEQAKTVRGVKIIFAAEPAATALFQEGSRIAIARDGTLFVTVGDRSGYGPWLKAQDMSTTLGKVIHITADGAPAPGNPFLNTPGVAPEIWSAGHRNQHGIAFDAAGQLWEIEFGPQGGDELNKIQRGKNYGWPLIVHGIDYTGLDLGDGAVDKPGFEQPQYYWDPVIAPSGLAFYSGALIPQWNGSVLVSALRGKQISRLTLKGDRVVAEEPLLSDMDTRFRDVRVDRDGAVIVLTEEGKLLKVVPK